MGGGHGCAWDAAVGQAWRKRRGLQPVSLPPPAFLVAKASLSFVTIERDFVLRKAGMFLEI